MKLCASFICGSYAQSDQYPTTYPFDKESVKPPALLDAGVPFDDANFDSPDNPGGYFRLHETCDPYSDKRTAYYSEKYGDKLQDTVPASYLATKPPGFRECRPQAYFFWKIIGNGKIPVMTYNCTEMSLVKDAPTQVSSASKWPSKFDNKDICTPGECCKFMDGALIEQFPRITEFMVTFGKHYTAGLCSEYPGPEVYCPYTSLPYMCLENFENWGKSGKKDNGRDVTYACYDNAWRWYQTCPLMKSSKLILDVSFEAGKWEVKSYQDKSTIAQLLVFEPMFKMPDRVCHPYSYYHPADSKAPTGTDSASATFTLFQSLAVMFAFVLGSH